MPRTLLLTGAAGFIGSHTAVALAARGDRVVGIDSFHPYYDPARKRANVREIVAEVPGGAFELVEGDIRDRELVSELFRKHRFDGVIHLAAMAGVRASVDDPFTYYDVNLTGTLVLLEAASRNGPASFVFASTSSAYGASTRLPFTEDDPADRPLAPYPASKRACELLGHSFHHHYGTSFTALRFFTVYGPRGRPDMLTYKLLEAIHTGRPLVLYEGGRMLRDWTFVSDIVAGIVAAVDAKLGYEVVNLGRGKPVLVSDYVRVFESITGKKVPYTDAPRLDSDVERTHANIDKARELLGYAPRVDVDEGARRFVEWFDRAILAGGGLG